MRQRRKNIGATGTPDERPPVPYRRLRILAAVLAALWLPIDADAQDSNIPLPVGDIDQALLDQPFKIASWQDNRFDGDRTQKVVLSYRDNSEIKVKWAMSADGGDAVNNRPRYELAAYEFQKLFLSPQEYVVPPTHARALPISWYRERVPDAKPTFCQTSSVLVVLQYWLSNVTVFDHFDDVRFQTDPVYARNIGNLNVFTHLAWHGDSNTGNFLISKDATSPRVFSVDHGMIFGGDESKQGQEWRPLRVDRLPRSTVDRLKSITKEDLDRALSVVAQYEVQDGRLVPVEPTATLNRFKGVRRSQDVIQLGLTSAEIRGVHQRLRKLIDRVDHGKIETF
jgi:hypothetical protein